MLRLLAILRAFCRRPLWKKEDDVFHRRPFIFPQTLICLRHRLPPANVKCIVRFHFMLQTTGHTEGVPHKWPLEDAASRSLFSGNHGYMCTWDVSASGCPHTRLRLLNSGEKTIFERTHVSLADRKHGRVLREWMNPLVSREICACAFNALSHRLMS